MVIFVAVAGLVLLFVSSYASRKLSAWVGLAGLVLILTGSYVGLFVAPKERHMGDVQRMLYVHRSISCRSCWTIQIRSPWNVG